MDNIFSLNQDLVNHAYIHGGYHHFKIADPKPRDIHKASVRDRLLHHAVYRVLYPFFDRLFIADSYSCRINNGTHKAVNRFRSFGHRASANHTRTAWVLKCDIRKFFANIDHAILLSILSRSIPDRDIMQLLAEIIRSHHSIKPGVGLPLGNLTSQIFVNIYMNEFDQFVKHCLKARYYLRYADDFAVISHNRAYLESILVPMQRFLEEKLKLSMHPDKIFIKTIASGIDFLGWVHFSDHRVLRTATKRRMLRRIAEHPSPETMRSYLGLLRHGNAGKLQSCLML